MTTKRTQRRYGWKRDLPDVRDKHKVAASADVVYPPSVDLRPSCPPVYDQGQLGSCTANAIAGAIQFVCMKANYKFPFTPSRLFIYYNERDIEGTTWYDSGAAIRDGIKSVNSQGVCPEDSKNNWNWAYTDNSFTFRIKPYSQCYTDALLHKALQYSAVNQDIQSMRAVLASGLPFVVGVSVYQSFENAKDGNVPMPDTSSESLLGGHAILIVGYDDANQTFIFRNSWGDKWGQAGYGTLPYSYLLNQNLSSDFWCVELVEGCA